MPNVPKPSVSLTSTVLGVVVAGLLIPYSPAVTLLGFTALPAPFFLFLAVATATYLGMVEVAKRRLFHESLSMERPLDTDSLPRQLNLLS